MSIPLRFLFICIISFLSLQAASGQALEIVSIGTQPARCFGEASGSITVTISGGTAPYSYYYGGFGGTQTIVSSESSLTFTGVNADPSYTVRVRDNNLVMVSNHSVEVGQPDPLNSFILPDPADICKDTPRFLDGNPIGGNGGYTHDWSGPGAAFLSSTSVVDPVFSSGVIGSHELTYLLTDQLGCQSTQVISIEVFETITASVSHEDVTCFEGNNGSITIGSSSGGSGTYQYSVTGYPWQDGNVFSGLIAGEYEVSVRDALYPSDCIATLAPVTITEPATAVGGILLSQTNVSCFGGADGSLTVEASGGTPGYQYSLDGGALQASATFSGLSAGTYIITISDANGCTFDVPVTITQPATALGGSILSQTNVSCFGGADGSLTVEASGGTPGYQYSLDGGAFQGSATFSGLGAAAYTVTIRDSKGCVFDVNVTITEPATALGGSLLSQTNVSCFGGANGSLTVEGNGGTPGYQYSLDGGAQQASGTFAGLSAGTYIITISDANGCTFDVPVTITEPATALGGSLLSQTNVSCFGGADGSLTAEGSGGTPGYQYSLDGGAQQASGTFAGLSAGTYVITVSDANGCTLDVPVTITQPTALGGTIVSQINVSCNGGTDGSITAEGSGGTAPYQYSLDGGAFQVSASFDNLSAGSYSITVRDAGGCTFNIPVTVPEPAPLFAELTYTDVTGCFGYETGTIEIINSQGSWAGISGNYEYTIDGWASSSTDPYFGSLPAGTYSVQLRDADNPGCVFIINGSLTLTQPDPITADIQAVHVDCFGGETGSIRFINVAGGTEPLQYTINGLSTPFQTSPYFPDLAAGTYDLRIRNITNPTCPVIIDPAFIITEPDQLNATVAKIDVTGCFGNNNGEIQISSPVGGSGNFQYSIDNASSWFDSGTFSGLVAGTYNVWIRDAVAVSCEEFLAEIEIIQPDELFAEFNTGDVTCFGASDGIIEIINAAGGSGSFEFSVDGISWQAGPVFSLLPAGDYTVLMRDSVHPACEINLGTASIAGPDAISLSVTSVTDNTCFGAAGGSITAEASGGTPGYTYTLFDDLVEVSTIEPVHPDPVIFENLGAGNTWRIVVTDSRGCDPAEISNIVITEPAELQISLVVPVNVVCFGEETGSITISAAGGTGTISFSVNGVDFVDNGGVFDNLGVGFYDVSVIDENGCRTDYGQVEITGPDKLAAELVSTNVTCFGQDNGIIEFINPLGGTSGNYEYSVNGADWFAGALFENLAPGTYSAFIRDTGVPSCIVETDDSPRTISEPDLLEMTPVLTNIDCNGNSSGSIEVNVTGGNGTFQYRLDGGAWQAENIFSGLPAGDYLVGVTDLLGCEISELVTLAEPALLDFDNIKSNDESCFGAGDGDIEILMTGGTAPFRYSVDGGLTFSDNNYFGPLAPALYDVVAEDISGCSVTQVIRIDPANEIVFDQFDVTDITCFGAADGKVEVTASGGDGSIDYSIDGVVWESSGTFNLLDKGDYTVWIRDGENCIITRDFSITEPEPVLLTSTHTDITCFGSANGTVIATGQGGIAPYTYKLFVGGIEHDVVVSADPAEFSGLVPGSYHVEMSDANGCMAMVSDAMTVTEPALLEITLVASENILCSGAENGEISVTAIGGTGIISYSANNGADFYENEGIFIDLAPGTYNVIVRDENGCEAVYPGDIVITQPDEIQITSSVVVDAGCFGAADGSIDVTATGGSGILEYSLGGTVYQGGGLFDNLTAGEYTVHVKDVNECVALFNFTVNEPAELIAEAQVMNISCHGISGDPEIRARATGGTAPYDIILYLGGVEQATFPAVPEDQWVVFELLVADMTDYEVMVDDGSGCGTASSGLLSTERPEEMVIGTAVSTNVLCFGADDATIEISVTGGSMPYTYSLFDAGNVLVNQAEAGGDALFEGLAAGTYHIEVTDLNGCGPVVSDDIIITQPPELVAENHFISHINCNGGNDGTISIAASGGTGDLQYSVDGGATFYPDAGFTGLTAGSYPVVVTDASGCITDTVIVEITEPDLLQFVLVDKDDIVIGSENESGSILIEAEGGTSPYQFSIDGGTTWQDGNNFTDLTEGSYDVAVSDANGCTINDVVDIEVITGISATTVLIPPSCYGLDDGVISIIGDTGATPFGYSIDNGGTFHMSGNFTGLSAGVYQVVVRDNHNLTYRETVTLDDPDPIVAVASATKSWCRESTGDGAISLDVSGGTGLYSYDWSDGSDTKDITGLEPGTYSVTVTDENQCDTSLTIEVGYEHYIDVSLPAELSVCPGIGVTLEPEVTQSGSTASYSWLASAGPDPDPVASPYVTPLSSTIYSLRVTDENNCYDEAEITVNQYPEEGISAGNDTVIFQGTSIELYARGGDFVSYDWTPGMGLSELDDSVTTATPVNETLYYVYATTENGCVEFDSVFIGIVQPIDPVSGFTPNNDGVNDFFEVPNAEDYPEISVEVYTRSGQRVFFSNGYTDEKRWDGTFKGKELPMGTYYFVITLNDIFGTKPVTGPITIVR